MLEPAAAAALVALGAAATVLVAAGGRTSGAAIQLAVIAVRTQHDLLAATNAQEQASGSFQSRSWGRQPKVLDGIAPEVQHCCCTTFIGTV
jgi:hypothetical protein